MSASSLSTNRERLSINDIQSQIKSRFQQFMEQNHIPGLAYGLVADGVMVTADGMGIQNITDKTPVSPESVFRIASMTKSFTAMSVVKLRDEGKLQLDMPLEQIIPELANLRYPTKDSALVTVRQIMTMSAGFPQDDPWADRQLAITETELSSWLGKGISFSNPPGIAYEYSNYGFAMLGRVVTNASGVPYQTYVQENILKPLGMKSTTFDVNVVKPKRLAMGYRWEDNQWVEEPPLPDGAFASIGGMFTTISDFARYMTFLLSAFPARDDAETGPVRRSSVREMQQVWRQGFVESFRQTPDAAAIVEGGGYGYGLQSSIDSVLGYSVAHGGGLPGYGTFYRILPDYGVGLVAFSNLTYARAYQPLDDVLYMLRGNGSIAPRLRTPTQALVDVQKALTQIYDQWDDHVIQAASTESFFQDMPINRRRKQFQELQRIFGKRQSTTSIDPENSLRGRWSMNCRRGRIDVFATLSPTVPPRLQYLIITAAQSLSTSFKNVVQQMVKLVNQWDEAKAHNMFDRKLKTKSLKPQLEAVRVLYGKVKLGDIMESDGTSVARMTLIGQKGKVDMKVTLNPKNGKVVGVAFTRPRETYFVP